MTATQQVRSRRTDVDEVAVYRRMHGDHSVPLNVAEREQVVTDLHAQHHSDAHIALLTGYTQRTVLRIRQRLNLPSNYEHGRPLQETS